MLFETEKQDTADDEPKEDFNVLGTGLFGDSVTQPSAAPLAKKFIFPPFSILDRRSGPWLSRKRAWASLGITNDDFGGREEDLTYGKSLTEYADMPTTSVFDPVVCELAYKWFCPTKGQVLDPFAGGPVRGVVAGALGYKYCGVDLRESQVTYNNESLTGLSLKENPTWITGNSLEILKNYPKDDGTDFVFSCPPYGDLEVYSDDPNDLSNMEWDQFLDAYAKIIALSIETLRPNSFACFVVANFRNKKGGYLNFVGDTIAAFEKAGAVFYNDGILIDPVGTGAARATRQFNAGSKLIKLHQNMLVFVKGDPFKATKRLNRDT